MKEKKGEPSSWRTCEIVQQLEYMSQEDVEAGLDHNAVQDYAYILHDKDVHEDGTPVAPHSYTDVYSAYFYVSNKQAHHQTSLLSLAYND